LLHKKDGIKSFWNSTFKVLRKKLRDVGMIVDHLRETETILPKRRIRA
jgi:hypothetical protein